MKYRIKLSAFLYIVIAVALVAAGVCFGFNAVRLFKCLSDPSAYSVYNYISIALCLIIPVVLVVFVFAFLFSSYYTVSDEKLIVKYGLLKDVYPLSEIDNIVRDMDKNQLLAFFKDESTLRFLIDEKNFTSVSADIIKNNPSVSYSDYAEKKNGEEEK